MADTSNTIENMLDLPPEIQLRVLSSLPAKTIQKCRRICKHFLELIDDPSNQGLCLDPGAAISFAEIQSDIDIFCNYPIDTADKDGTPTALVNAMVVFADAGRVGSHMAVVQNLRCFARHWLHRCFAGSPDDCEENVKEFMSVIFAIMFTAMSPTTKATGDEVDKAVADTRDGFVALARQQPNVQRLAKVQSEASFDQLLLAVPHTELLMNLSYRPADSEHGQRYLRFHAQNCAAQPDWVARFYQISNHTMSLRLEALLGLPRLPSTAPITYCVKSEWARHVINTLLQRQVSTDPSLPEWGLSDASAIMECGQKVGRIKRAALLEEIIIG
ncbi:Putative F-box domain-containing protein [Septoria linicola]|uniref:F-box domain-containing protein n=1 Tax=Septoria linicola TaxID=215465 RepID=A0A9Q9ALH3_9PEZI|nr:putative F-box domain-containing protein [Septoria linicola]USW50229.1 Putative F-box domain-containing protein [Septoria linicola]